MKKRAHFLRKTDNRLKFKMSILDKFWGEIGHKEEYSDLNLIIDERVKN